MSDTATDWQDTGGEGSNYMDTPAGRALISKEKGTDEWSARIETPDGTRQSQRFATREEAEAWVEQQVVESQRMVDTVPSQRATSSDS